MSGALYDFDMGDLGAYLAENIAGFGALETMTKFSDGQSNPSFHLRASGGDFVLRAKPPGDLLKSAHQVDREFRVMRALAHTDAPVPGMRHLSGADNPLGAMFFVMDFVKGRIFWDPALPELSREDRSAVYDRMNRTLAALHSVDPAVVGLEDYGRPGNYFERQYSRWSKQYRAAEMGTIEDADWLIGWLGENLVEDDGAVSLVHGDYRIDNMIFHPEKPEILALLDWELSTLGHPMADLAYQCMQWRMPAGNEGRGLAGADREALGIPTEEAYIALYCQRRGIERIEHWPFYLAFSYFRMFAILQGVIRRAADGNASNPHRLEMMKRAVPQLARAARDIVGQAG